MQKQNIAISVKDLKKTFLTKEVLKGISFSVHSGTIYTLLGSNGAGKTTTIRILTTQVKRDSGKAEIYGYDVAIEPKKVHELISLTGQFSAVDEALTGKENLVIMGKLLHLSEPEKRADELLTYFELSKSSEQLVSTYSGGMKRKLDIAMSLVGNSKILFLDEPTTGLDPQSRHKMWDIIRELKQAGITIFLTTQYLEEAEQLADKISILDKGKIIAEGTPEQLKAYLPHGVVQFIFPDTMNFNRAKNLLTEYRMSEIQEEYKLTIFTDGKADTLSKIFHRLFESNISIQDFSKFTPNLEDVFLAMISESEDNFDENQNKKI